MALDIEEAMKHLYHLHPRKEVRHFRLRERASLKGEGKERRERNEGKIAAERSALEGGSSGLVFFRTGQSNNPEVGGQI